MDPSLIQPRVDAAIAALAARQHGALSLEQLRELGLSATAVRERAGSGRLHHIHRGVYALVRRSLLTPNGLYMAAVLACGPGALLSHRSAGLLHGLIERGGTRIDVTIPGRNARRHKGIAIHRSTTLAPADAAVVAGIPCTTPARTLSISPRRSPAGRSSGRSTSPRSWRCSTCGRSKIS